jgi:hypothetical protein
LWLLVEVLAEIILVGVEVQVVYYQIIQTFLHH